MKIFQKHDLPLRIFIRVLLLQALTSATLLSADDNKGEISLNKYFMALDLSFRQEPAHPFLPRPVPIPEKQLEALKKNLAPVMKMSYKDISALIDEQGDINFHYSPDGGQLTWNIKRPWVLTDSKSGRVFPNKDYPMKELKIIDPTGKKQSYFYYKSSNGDQFFFQAYCRTFIRNYFVARIAELAQIYSQTGEMQYARKALEILARFAEVYPHWPYRSYVKNEKLGWFRRVIIYSKGDKIVYNNWGGKWQSRWCAAEIQYDAALVRAYDLVYNENILKELSSETGIDVRKQIEEELLLGMVRQVMEYPAGYFAGNAAGSIFINLAITGKVLGYPELVHLAYAMLDNLIRQNFLFDNMWRESTIGYHDMTMRLIDGSIKSLRGYSDPPGFKGKDGRHFENIDINVTAQHEAPKVLSFPNGYIVPVNDSKISASSAKMLPRNSPTTQQHTDFLSATGHLSLGRGTGKDQMQYHLTFTDDRGHRHIDMLSTIMFAKNREMISDFGYSHSGLRPWSASTLAHNTVLADGQMQKHKNGSLLYLLPNTGPVTAAEAKATGAYPQCETYKRFVAVIDDSDENAFVVDIFRIKGGKIHDWVMHGSADNEMTLCVTPPIPTSDGTWLGNDMKYIPGRDQYSPGKIVHGKRELKPDMEIKDTEKGYQVLTKQTSAFHPFYGLLKSVARGKEDKTAKASFIYCDKADTGFNLYMLNKENSEIFAGVCPSIRKEWKYLPEAPDSIPVFMCRRSVTGDTANVFSTVIEPFSGKPFIKSVKDIKENGDTDSTAIEVASNEKSHLILNTSGNTGKVQAKQTELDGRLGVISLKDGKALTLLLSDGTALKYGDWLIKADNNYNGTINSSVRFPETGVYYFDAKTPLPEGNLLNGNIIIVAFDNCKSYGYKISRIEKLADGSRIYLAQEPGFIIKDNNVQFLFYPHQSYHGLPTFVIPNKVMLDINADQVSITANVPFLLKTPNDCISSDMKKTNKDRLINFTVQELIAGKGNLLLKRKNL